MATLNTAVQALVDNLHAKMIAQPPELTAEEQLLVSKALSALSDNTTWEQALVAVATEHLNTATSNMDTAVTTATTSIDSSVATATSNFAQAQADMTAALTNATNQLNAAKTNIDTKAADLAMVAKTKAAVSKLQDTGWDTFGNIGNLFTTVHANNLLHVNNGTNWYGLGNIMTIFSSGGDVDMMTVPEKPYSSTTSSVNECTNWYKLTAVQDAKFDPHTRVDYCTPCSGTNAAYLRDVVTKKGTYYGFYGIAKLASSTDPNDIQTKNLIADNAGTSSRGLRGIGFYNDAGYDLSDGYGHWNTHPFKDKYSRYSTNDNNGMTSGYAMSYFYDNDQNSIVVIQGLKVWRLYNDGWQDTGITFGSNILAQDWIDAQSDMFLVPMWSPTKTKFYRPMHYGGDYNRNNNRNFHYAFQDVFDTGYNLSNFGMAIGGGSQASSYRWYMGSEVLSDAGGLPYDFGNSDNTNQYGWKCSKSYLWDETTKTLIPLARVSSLELMRETPFAENATASNWWRIIKLRTKFTRLDTEELVGETVHLLENYNNSGQYSAYYAVDIPHYNPYTNTEYLQSINRYSTSYYHNIDRCMPVTHLAGPVGK